MKKMYSQSELADFIGTSQSRISRLVKEGAPCEQPRPRLYVFELEEFLTWLSRRSTRDRRWVGNFLERVKRERLDQNTSKDA